MAVTVDSAAIDLFGRESWLQFTGTSRVSRQPSRCPRSRRVQVLSPASRRPDWIRWQLTTSTITLGEATGGLFDPLATSRLPGTVAAVEKATAVIELDKTLPGGRTSRLGR